MPRPAQRLAWRLAAAAPLAAAFLLPAPAAAATRGAWSVVATRHGATVTWTSPTWLPTTDARPEFRLDGRPLGLPATAGRRLVLRVSSLPRGGTSALSAWLGARRLDGPTPRAATGRQPAAAIPAGPVGAAVAVDPGAPGPYATARAGYTLPSFAIPGYRVRSETVGEVVYPVGAPGARPLVLFLHGRHGTCYRRRDTNLVWPCPAGWRPIPSYLGYTYIQERLASQGYVTVSIAANAINAQDGAIADAGAEGRAALIRHHLGLIASWSQVGGAPFGPVLLGKVDVARTILVGHSRGGEGVERAAIDGPGSASWRIRGLVPIAPTAFGRQVALAVPTAVLLPSCDGDVSDLQGQAYVDGARDLGVIDTALRSAVFVVGASHNLFNTQWTPGLAAADAFDDSSCPGSRRHLTPTVQRRVGTAYVAALVHAALDAQPDAVALLDGSRVHAPSAGSATVLSSALGGRRTLLFHAGDAAHVGYRRSRAATCPGYIVAPDTGVPCTQVSSPHWTPPIGMADPPAQDALAVRWASTGSAISIGLATPVARDGASDLDLRAIVDTASPGFALAATLHTDTGATVHLTPVGTTRLPLPLFDGTTVLWAQTLRFRLPAGDATYTRLDLAPASPRGRIWLLDAALRSPGLGAIAPISLPRVDVGSGTAVEGDGERRVLDVPLTVTGSVPAGAHVWLSTFATGGLTAGPRRTRVAIPPGATTVHVRIPFRGDDYFDVPPASIYTLAFAETGAGTGAYVATSTPKEDDPRPGVIVGPRAITVHEGQRVRLRVAVSRPVGPYVSAALVAVRVRAGQRALSTGDLPDADLNAWGVFERRPDRALARAAFAHDASLGLRITSVVVGFRPLRDGVAEGPEHLRLRLYGYGAETILPRPIDIEVTVLDG